MEKSSLKRLHIVCFHLSDIMKKANYGDNKKQNQCYGRDWLWGKLSLALVCRAMLSKSLMQFSIDGWSFVPSLLFERACEVAQSCPTPCDPNRWPPTRLLCPWDFPGNSTGVDCHFLLQGIFPTQRSIPGLLHHRQMLYRLSHQGSVLLFTRDQTMVEVMKIMATSFKRSHVCTATLRVPN